MLLTDFPLSSDECRLLLLLETTGSIKEAAAALGRDVSVVSRQVSRFAGLTVDGTLPAPVVEKINGRWQVSEIGKRVNAWTRDAVLAQRRALRSVVSLRVGSTREFASRILAPGLPELTRQDPCAGKIQVTLVSTDDGVESLLLAGEVDFAFDCGRPRDPAVRFTRVASEPFVVVAAPKLLRKRAPKSLDELVALPHLYYSRLSAARALKLPQELPNLYGVFSDLAAARAAAIAGLGWAVLPRYACADELKAGLLKELPGSIVAPPEAEFFGVWWLRDRKSVDPWAQLAISWLKQQKL